MGLGCLYILVERECECVAVDIVKSSKADICVNQKRLGECLRILNIPKNGCHPSLTRPEINNGYVSCLSCIYIYIYVHKPFCVCVCVCRYVINVVS